MEYTLMSVNNFWSLVWMFISSVLHYVDFYLWFCMSNYWACCFCSLTIYIYIYIYTHTHTHTRDLLMVVLWSLMWASLRIISVDWLDQVYRMQRLADYPIDILIVQTFPSRIEFWNKLSEFIRKQLLSVCKCMYIDYHDCFSFTCN